MTGISNAIAMEVIRMQTTLNEQNVVALSADDQKRMNVDMRMYSIFDKLKANIPTQV